MKLPYSELKKNGILLFTNKCNIKILAVSFKSSIIAIRFFTIKAGKICQAMRSAQNTDVVESLFHFSDILHMIKS